MFNYHAHIVPIKEGKGWIVDGHFKFVHVVNLEQFVHLIGVMNKSLTENVKDHEEKTTIEYHLHQMSDRLKLLKGKPERRARSIDWLGSAWKWIAGSPDATDWNKILQSEQSIVNNNNHQYKVNSELFGVIGDITSKTNWLIDQFKNGVKGPKTGEYVQDLTNRVLIVKDEINEVVRACQLAKSGLVNTNLLNKEEINRIISEIETLPYVNEIQAIEYGSPSIYTNGSLLLYTLSIPKVRNEEYNLLLTRPSIINGAQIDLEFSKMLVNSLETFGITGECLSINNSTVCHEESLKKLSEDSCVARLLKGGHTTCTFRSNNEEVVELIDEDTIFLTNFEGQLTSGNYSSQLNGTYVIRLSNETIYLKNKTFSTFASTNLQVLPPALTDITNRVQKIDLEHVHGLSIKNIKRLKELTQMVTVSSFTYASIVILGVLIAYFLWRRINLDPRIPPIIRPGNGPEHVAREDQPRVPRPRLTQIWSSGSDVTSDLRDVDF